MSRSNGLTAAALKRVETNVHGKLKDWFLNNYLHSVAPGFNLSATSPFLEQWNVDNVTELYQEFPYYCDYPKPLLPPVKLPLKGDPALQLVLTKKDINDDINRILDYYQSHKKLFNPIPLKKETKWEEENGSVQALVPRYVADIAAMIEMDPDPHFTGNYNWYYTGGSLDSFTLGGQTNLIFPYVGDLVAAPILPKPNALWKPDLSKACSCEIDGTIYELRKAVQSDSCKILGRFKNHCNFYSIKEDDERLEMILVHRQNSTIPYVSADIDSTNSNRFCTIDVDRTATLWDIGSCQKMASYTIEVTKVLNNKWGSIRFMKSDPSTIVFTDNCCIHYLDTRQSMERPVLSLCPKSHLNNCENLCLEVASRSENHSYVGSYHSLLMCDRRVRTTECVQQRWTHQFKCAPIFAAIQTRDEKEIIVLSSQLPGETSIILNTWDNYDNSFSYHMPYTPRSILETLTEVQLQGKCLDPSMRKRLDFSNAGTTVVVDDDGKMSLFQQSSIGDMFYQCITHDEILDKFSLINGQAYYAMEAWEKRILLQDPVMKPLVITNRVNMHHIFENFTDKSLILEVDDQPKESLREPKWKQSVDVLKTYVDILAPELLAVWEVTDDNVTSVQPAVPHQKVINWLEEASQKSVDHSQLEPRLILTPIDSQELYSVSQQPELIDIADAEALEEISYPPVKVKTRRKPQAKKKTYVAGF